MRAAKEFDNSIQLEVKSELWPWRATDGQDRMRRWNEGRIYKHLVKYFPQLTGAVAPMVLQHLAYYEWSYLQWRMKFLAADSERVKLAILHKQMLPLSDQIHGLFRCLGLLSKDELRARQASTKNFDPYRFRPNVEAIKRRLAAEQKSDNTAS